MIEQIPEPVPIEISAGESRAGHTDVSNLAPQIQNGLRSREAHDTRALSLIEVEASRNQARRCASGPPEKQLIISVTIEVVRDELGKIREARRDFTSEREVRFELRADILEVLCPNLIQVTKVIAVSVAIRIEERRPPELLVDGYRLIQEARDAAIRRGDASVAAPVVAVHGVDPGFAEDAKRERHLLCKRCPEAQIGQKGSLQNS
ncbi:MAG: hypothetical protein JNM84_18445 [Planctomycetes bacterium]|nr:hypothetical protein [Planctomycetota bacterium]